MNYYSTDILNSIIDTSDLNDLADRVREFVEDTQMLFVYFAFERVNLDYITNLLGDPMNKVVFRCIDTDEFNIRNCPSAMVYRRCVYNSKRECVYYILLICTKSNFKKLGYASAMLDDFITRIRDRHSIGYRNRIIVSSMESAISYYEKYGFVMTTDTLDDHPTLKYYEMPEEDGNTYIMELDV